MRISVAAVIVTVILMSGCMIRINFVSPHEDIVSVHEQWRYGCCTYEFDFDVDTELYSTVNDSPRPYHDSEFGEFVDLAYGPGLSEVEELSSIVDDLVPPPESARREIEFVTSFVRSLSDGATGRYGRELKYPLEVVLEGGSNCADLSALAASMLNSLGFDVGIAVFMNDCCAEDIHVALGVANFYSNAHGIDGEGTKWVFVEMVESDACQDVGIEPDWLDEYSDWLVWPLWEYASNSTTPRRLQSVNAPKLIDS